MSEDADKSSKTEEPTAKKLADAREQGTVAVSREVNTWMLLMAGGVALVMFLPDIAKDFRFMLLKFIEQPHTIPFDAENMHVVMSKILMDFLRILSIPFILFVVVAIGAGILQNGVNFSPKALEPKISKFSPKTGPSAFFPAGKLSNL